jgi:hypothetical protein
MVLLTSLFIVLLTSLFSTSLIDREIGKGYNKF